MATHVLRQWRLAAMIARPHPVTENEPVQYQLVLQLPGASRDSFEEMLALEAHVAAALTGFGVVDGHDAGSGEVNIFVLTDHPIRAFERLMALPEIVPLLPKLRAAYRAIDSENFEILYPPGDYVFTVT